MVAAQPRMVLENEALAKFDRIHRAFEHALDKESAPATKAMLKTARSKAGEDALGLALDALLGVQTQLEQREQSRFQRLQDLKDGKRKAIKTRNGIVRGVVKEIKKDRIRVKGTAQINKQSIEFERVVLLADLSEKGREELFGKIEPSNPREWLTTAFLALKARNWTTATEALKHTGEKHLAGYYRQRIIENLKGEKEAAVKLAWQQFLDARGKRKKVNLEGAESVRMKLDEFMHTYGQTKFVRDHKDRWQDFYKEIHKVLGLVAHWKLEEAKIGDPVVDATGNGHNGKHTDNPKISTEVPPGNPGDRGGVLFDGNADSIELNKVRLGTKYSLVIWYKHLGDKDGNLAATAWSHYLINIGGDTFTYIGGYYEKIHVKHNLLVDQWNHVVLTRNGQELKWYRNGELLDTNRIKRTQGDTLNAIANGHYKHQALNGHISDYRFYNRPLHHLEIWRLAGNKGYPPAPVKRKSK